ncbi:expressed unknown protein [Seminavis robusta]|uniref:Uncharacterized protein n=1 Tax=Seminavis robusta TaxID=568900 RepID=A0A9N8EWL2_9STRA|nr:expressed unknown protein [Seminavis robusta]|eukprot:Sro1768_g296341.1  (192) ;mRNA; r:1738-2313
MGQCQSKETAVPPAYIEIETPNGASRPSNAKASSNSSKAQKRRASSLSTTSETARSSDTSLLVGQAETSKRSDARPSIEAKPSLPNTICTQPVNRFHSTSPKRTAALTKRTAALRHSAPPIPAASMQQRPGLQRQSSWFTLSYSFGADSHHSLSFDEFEYASSRINDDDFGNDESATEEPTMNEDLSYYRY